MVVPAAGAHRAPEVAKGVLKEVQRSMGEWRFENHHEIAMVAPAGFEPVFEANLAWAKSQTPLSRRSAPWVQEVLAPDEALYEVLESRNAIVSFPESPSRGRLRDAALDAAARLIEL